ncbi:hypothetical protein M9Y10_038778 [Tritrichomonas musculus]|uniref:Kelch motif family protein n=1 Tax=Tritrichomonas musculus TaxID=1915356 RepID=A0ABR2K9K4_9EUKA
MLDILDPPSLKNLKLDSHDNASEKIARVTTLLQSDASRTFCFHEERLFCKLNDANKSYLLYLKSNSDVWEFVDQLPFGYREGQSLTSTYSGMAFFGGANSTTFYNDLWIYMNTTEWFTVPTDIPARKNQAVNCDAQGHLIIYGGTGPNGTLNDLYVIDITTQEVKQIQLINNSPLPRLTNHSLTLLKDGTFFLFGKDETNLNAGSKKFTYIANFLDIENGTLLPIQTEFENAIDSSNYYTSYIYGLVFLFGLTQNQPIWMFDLTNNIWIPFSMAFLKSQSLRPLFLFISEAFSQKKSIHLVDHTLLRLITIPVFSSSPPEDVHESPQFIHFLRTHLKAGCSYFDSLKVQYNLESEKVLDKIKNKFDKQSFVNNYLSLTDMYDLSKELEKKAEKIYAMMNLSENQFNINLTNMIHDSYLLSSDNLLKKDLNAHEILSATNEIRKKGKEEITRLSEIAESLSRQIEQSSFLTIFNSFNAQQPQQQRALSPNYISQLQKSSQLANEIQFEQSRLADEQKKIKSLGFTKKNKLINLRYQIWSVTQSEYQKFEKLKEVKKNFFNAVADIYSLRHQELQINDLKARNLAENYIKKPDLITEMKKAQDNLKKLKASFSAKIDDLGLDDNSRQEGSYFNKLIDIANDLEEMKNWIDEANLLLMGQTSPLSQSQQMASPANQRPQIHPLTRSNTTVSRISPPPMTSPLRKPKPRFNNPLLETNEYFTRFAQCIGNSETYLSDLQNVLSRIENVVDIFNF